MDVNTGYNYKIEICKVKCAQNQRTFFIEVILCF